MSLNINNILKTKKAFSRLKNVYASLSNGTNK